MPQFIKRQNVYLINDYLFQVAQITGTTVNCGWNLADVTTSFIETCSKYTAEKPANIVKLKLMINTLRCIEA